MRRELRRHMCNNISCFILSHAVLLQEHGTWRSSVSSRDGEKEKERQQERADTERQRQREREREKEQERERERQIGWFRNQENIAPDGGYNGNNRILSRAVSAGPIVSNENSASSSSGSTCWCCSLASPLSFFMSNACYIPLFQSLLTSLSFSVSFNSCAFPFFRSNAQSRIAYISSHKEGQRDRNRISWGRCGAEAKIHRSPILSSTSCNRQEQGSECSSRPKKWGKWKSHKAPTYPKHQVRKAGERLFAIYKHTVNHWRNR